MLTFDQLRRLTRLHETAPDQACEVSLFYNPLSGHHRLVVRELHRAGDQAWRRKAPGARRVIPSPTPAHVATLFGVDEGDARTLLDLARQEADGV